MSERINNTTTFPITAPATDDLLIGTDVSNTSNNAGGEAVNFRAGDIAALANNVTTPDLLNTNLGTGSATAVGTILDVTDLTNVGQLLVYGELGIDAASDQSGTVTVNVAHSTDNGSTFGSASAVPGATLSSGGNPQTGQYVYVVTLTGSQDAVRFTLATGGSAPQSPSADVTAIGIARK